MPNPEIWKYAGKGGDKLRGRPQSAEHVRKRVESLAKTLKRTRRVCAHCGKKFRPAQGAQRYCSGQCWNAVARKRRSKVHRMNVPKVLYTQLSEAQGRKCAICGALSGNNARRERLAVDHCHETKHIRGLLCHRCNTAIGLFRHNQDIIARAAAYLASPPFNILVSE